MNSRNEVPGSVGARGQPSQAEACSLAMPRETQLGEQLLVLLRSEKGEAPFEHPGRRWYLGAWGIRRSATRLRRLM